MIKDEMDRIYSLPSDEVPWNFETPPEALVALVESKKVKPCKAIDLGCGTGFYALYMAKRGFEMTAIDLSVKAIALAKNNAKEQELHCDFIVADLLGNLREINTTFDFAYDWELLHHIFPVDRVQYVENVNKLLNPGGRYLSVSFSEQNLQFGGVGKYRKTSLDTELYFSSESEMIELFEPFFKIDELKTIAIRGKTSTHSAIYAFLLKK